MIKKKNSARKKRISKALKKNNSKNRILNTRNNWNQNKRGISWMKVISMKKRAHNNKNKKSKKKQKKLLIKVRETIKINNEMKKLKN